jgi:hypothetical protein
MIQKPSTPTANQLHIEGEISYWILTDSKGALIKGGTNNLIDVEALNPGMYYLNVGGEVREFKI